MRVLTIVSIILVVITVGYALFRSQNVILGPAVVVEYPAAHERVPQVFTLRGNAQDVSFLTLNDRRIYPDRDGVFEEELVMPVGYTIVEIHARNRQQRETTIHLPLYIQPYDTKKHSKEQNTESESDRRREETGE